MTVDWTNILITFIIAAVAATPGILAYRARILEQRTQAKKLADELEIDEVTAEATAADTITEAAIKIVKDGQRQIEDGRRQIKDLQKRVKTLETRVETLEDELAEEQSTATILAKENGWLRSGITQLINQLAAHEMTPVFTMKED